MAKHAKHGKHAKKRANAKESIRSSEAAQTRAAGRGAAAGRDVSAGRDASSGRDTSASRSRATQSGTPVRSLPPASSASHGSRTSSREFSAAQTAALPPASTKSQAAGSTAGGLVVYGAHARQEGSPPNQIMAKGHASPVAEVHRRKSRRTRIKLIVVSVIMALAIAGLFYLAYTLVTKANSEAQNSVGSEGTTLEGVTADAGTVNTDTHGDVPELTSLLGLTVDEAVEQVGRGATITADREITEEVESEDDADSEDDTDGEDAEVETQVVGRSVTVTLADVATDSSGNATALYLETDETDTIVSVGFSTPVSTLNYGEVSFEDIVVENHIVENLLNDAGLVVELGTVELPAAEDYRTYATDGTTVERETHTFSGTATDEAGTQYDWTCRLSYDYTTANVSNDLSDTIKLIRVYVYA